SAGPRRKGRAGRVSKTTCWPGSASNKGTSSGVHNSANTATTGAGSTATTGAGSARGSSNRWQGYSGAGRRPGLGSGIETTDPVEFRITHPRPLQDFPALLSRTRADVGPDLIGLLRAQLAAPCRHLAASFEHRLLEAGPVLRAQLTQIRNGAGAPELLAMAHGAMIVIERFASRDLRLILRHRERVQADQRRS